MAIRRAGAHAPAPTDPPSARPSAAGSAVRSAAEAAPGNTAAKASAKRGAKAPAKSARAAAPAIPADGEWTAAELADVRADLGAQVAAMGSRYDESVAVIEELQQRANVGSGDDQVDAGSATFEREQEFSIAANRLDLIVQMQRAIERIDAGAYGLCESCGKPIPKARLQAFPAATLDVGCKQREERR